LRPFLLLIFAFFLGLNFLLQLITIPEIVKGASMKSKNKLTYDKMSKLLNTFLTLSQVALPFIPPMFKPESFEI